MGGPRFTTALLVGVTAFCWLHSAAAQPCALEAGSSHAVARAIDGETLLLDDGQEVRLIGALAPKPETLPVDGPGWPAAQDALRALQTLVHDRTIALRYEGRRHDRYGRILAQVFVADGGTDVWVQERLVADGHARAYTLPGNTSCLGGLLKAEPAARVAKRGLWQRETYRVRSADDVESLLKLVGRFVLVEGRVAEVTRAQRTTYINFGTDWRRDFTANLATANVTDSSAATTRVDGLVGKRIRVRGWIERRNGPMIGLSSLDGIELLEEGSEPP